MKRRNKLVLHTGSQTIAIVQVSKEDDTVFALVNVAIDKTKLGVAGQMGTAFYRYAGAPEANTLAHNAKQSTVFLGAADNFRLARCLAQLGRNAREIALWPDLKYVCVCVCVHAHKHTVM